MDLKISLVFIFLVFRPTSQHPAILTSPLVSNGYAVQKIQACKMMQAMLKYKKVDVIPKSTSLSHSNRSSMRNRHNIIAVSGE